jgi:predicted DNA-binding transcriptional regulator AlpA
MHEAELLRERQVTQRFGFTGPWLRRSRHEGRGPKFIRLGRMVFYRVTDIAAYLAANEISTDYGVASAMGCELKGCYKEGKK